MKVLQNLLPNSSLINERSKKVASNVIGSFIVKLFSTLVTLALIPASLHYVEEQSYGLWLTIASVITWFDIFDFGLSNGLTNLLSEAFAKDDTEIAHTYLSTTYFLLLIIVGLVTVVFIIISPHINWNNIFNTKTDAQVLHKTINIAFLSFAFLFLLKPVTSLLMAKQRHFIVNLVMVSGNLFALMLIYFLGPSVANNRLIFLAAVLAFAYPVSLLIFSVIAYAGRYKQLRPSYKKIDLSYRRKLFGLSIKFFVIQIAVIAILTANNFFIAHFINNGYVVYYNIAYRLFSTVSVLQLLFLQPMWTAFTNAYTLKDYDWIKNVMNRLNKINMVLCIALLAIFSFRTRIFEIWIGHGTVIPFEISVILTVYFMFYLFNQTYVYFINGAGKINLQMLFCLLTIILQYPLAYLLMKKLNFGISGLLLLNTFWIFVSLILWKVQYKKLMSGKSLNKIWL